MLYVVEHFAVHATGHLNTLLTIFFIDRSYVPKLELLVDSLQELRINDKLAFCEPNICHDSYTRGSVFSDLIFFVPTWGNLLGV